MRALWRRLIRRPAEASGRIVLHIGRNKAGSTTLQDLCLAHRGELLAQGIDYRPFGHLADSVPGVPGFARFEALSEHARAHPERRILVSNEFMFGWPDAYTVDAGKALAGCDVRLLAYIRPYDAWIVSAYAEETRRGMNMRDIDAYLEAMAPRISAWPHLKTWGDTFGWDRLRVRTLDPRGLEGGRLEADFLHALGARLPAAAAASNVAPSWMELELTRAMVDRDGDSDWAGAPREEVEPLVRALAPLASAAPSTLYLTRAQRQALVELYNADLARLEGEGGPPLPRAEAGGPERAFVPAFSETPADILAALARVVGSEGFRAAHPRAAARFSARIQV